MPPVNEVCRAAGPSTPTDTPQQAGREVVYAQSGDRPADVARRYGVAEAALRNANPGMSEHLAPGDAVNLPVLGDTPFGPEAPLQTPGPGEALQCKAKPSESPFQRLVEAQPHPLYCPVPRPSTAHPQAAAMPAPAAGPRPPEAQPGQKDQGGLLSEVLKGDFHEGKTTWLGTAANVGIGLIPVVGQAADLRDTVAAGKNLLDDPSWSNAGLLGMAVVGWIPGLGDAIKGAGKAGRHVAAEAAQGVAEKAARNVAEKGATEASEKSAKNLADHNVPHGTGETPGEVAIKRSDPAPATIKGSSRPSPGEVLVGSSTKQMRAAAQRMIAADESHPLRFLLDQNGKLKEKGGMGLPHHELANRPDLVQMGHIRSKKSGGEERIMLQGAWENQFNNETIEKAHIGGEVLDQAAVGIGGIAVDLQTARFWESVGLLAPGTVKNAPRVVP